MADSDKSLDILVRIISETYGAKETQEALEKLKGETKDTGTEYAGLTDATKKYIKSLEDEGSETLSNKEKKHALHMVLHSLGPEYAGLAQISKFFFNPALLATAGLVAATELYKRRIEEMTTALAGVQLPDLGPHIKQLSAATQLSRDYETALGGILQKYNSIESQTARALDEDAKIWI